MPNGASKRIARLVGPYYSRRAVSQWLDLSDEQIDDMVNFYELFECKSREGDSCFPVWQFTPSGTLLPGLSEAISILAAGSPNSWTWGVWLRTPVRSLDGISAAEWLIRGKDKHVILERAKRDAARWSE